MAGATPYALAREQTEDILRSRHRLSRHREIGADADRQHPIRYRPLLRA